MQTILHLTDLHFGWEGGNPLQKANRKLCLDGMLEMLRTLEAAWKPMIICLTGDLAWQGSQADYISAKGWLDDLLGVCGLGYESLVVCAGNHDVIRTAAKKIGRPSTAVEADEVLAPPIAKQHEEVFGNFIAFCRDNGIPTLQFGADSSYLVGARTFNGLRFVVINSAWFCKDDEDKGELWLGLPHLRYMTASGQLPALPIKVEEQTTVVLMHHPQEWFRDDDIHATITRQNTFDYLARSCHLLLTGHTHGEVRAADQLAGQALHYTGGSAFAGAAHFNSFRLLQIDGDTVTDLAFKFQPNAVVKPWEPSMGERRLLGGRRHSAGKNPVLEENLAAEADAPFDPPDRRFVKFVGRDAVISQIVALLEEGKSFFVHGPSGIGKSAVLAETFGRPINKSRLHRRFPDGVGTVTVQKGQPADTVYSNICITFRVAQIASAKAAATRFIKEHRALVIIDSTEYFDEFAEFAAAQRAGCVVGASTKFLHDFEGTPIHLEPLSMEDAARMLLEEARKPYDSPAEQAAVREICRLVGRLPFAVRLAAVAISQHGGYVPSTFAPLLAVSSLDALDEASGGTARITYLLDKNLALAGEKGRRVFQYLGLLANSPVPIHLLVKTTLPSHEYVRAALADLATSSLVEWADEAKETCIVTHALAHTFAANQVGSDAEKASALVEELCLACETLAADAGKMPGIRPHIVPLLKACLLHGMFTRAIDLAMRLVVQHDPRIAWAEQEEALRLAAIAAETTRNTAASAEILAAQGLRAIVNGQYHDAKSALEHSLSLRAGTEATIAAGQVHLSLARCHFLLGDYGLARGQFETARGQFEAAPGGQACIPDVLVGVSVVDYGIADFRKAKEGYSLAIRSYDDLSVVVPPEHSGIVLWRKADALYQRAFTNLALGNIDEGTADVDAALSMATNRLGGDPWISGYSMDARGYFMAHAGEMEEARECFERAREFHHLVSDGWGTSLSHTGLGVLLLAMDLLEEAKEQFTRAYNLQCNLAENVLRGHTCGALAAIAFQQRDWATGRQLAREAEEISERTGNQRSVAVNFLLEAYRLFLRGDYEEASKFYKKGKEVSEQTFDARGQVRAGFGLAQCHLAVGDLGSAKEELMVTMTRAAGYQDRLGELATVRLLIAHSDATTPEDVRLRLAKREAFLGRGLALRGLFWLHHFA